MSRQKLKMSLVIFLLCSLFNMGIVIAGTTGKIAGKVVDAETGEPLPGANVYIEETSMGAATDMNGDFFILNVYPGVYDVTAQYMGYVAEKRTTVMVRIDKTTSLDFELKAQVLEGESVVVVAQKEDALEKDLTATKQSYDVGSLESIAGMNDVGDIIDLQADVDNGHFRGGRSGEALYLVGGATIVNPLNNNQAFEPLTIGLEQVEVYTSGFSAEYGNVQSGVINMVSKEGDSEKWNTYFDISSTNSYYKTFGGSVYSTDYNNDYNDLFLDTEEWATQTDPVSGNILWTHFGIRFPENYLPASYTIPSWPPVTVNPSQQDSMKAAALVKQMWMQSARDMGLEFASPDYRLEFSLDGPLNEKMTMFIAGRQNVVNPIIPTGRANIHRQVMANVTWAASSDDKVKFSYNFDQSFNNSITTNYYRWFERVMNVNKQTEGVHQFGVNWTHILNPSTFFEMKANYLTTTADDRIDVLSDTTWADLYNNSINWRHYTAPNGYNVGRLQTSYGDEKTQTFFFNGAVTSQVNKFNLVKAGFQFTYYDIDVNNVNTQSTEANVRYEDYRVFPYEGAAYIQDKMEFEDLVTNIGLRLDFYNLNTEYYTNKYSPYLNPNFDPTDPSQGAYYDKELASKKKTELKYIFQPRIGIAFPVSDKSVLHLNYGVFTQRPAFEYIFGQSTKLTATPDYEALGNPQLEPERTISYDVGIVRSLPAGFHLDVSAYLKDVSNQIMYAVYEDNGGNRYFTYDNREYADIKGFHITLDRNTGLIRGYLRYNWEAAKGKSGSAEGSGARAEYFENDAQEDLLPAPDDVYLDFNRLHKVVANISLHVPNEGGFAIGEVYPLSNVTINATYKFSSGRPFTWDLSGQGLQMNMRTPDEKDLNIRVEKKMSVGGTGFTLYVEAFNVLNHKVFHYSRVFEDAVNSQNLFKERYMTDRENLLTQTDFSPYTTSLDGYLYSNQPRHYRFGISMKF